MVEVAGSMVTLRPAREDDVDVLVAIRSTPEVHRRWRGDDLAAEVADDIASADLTLLAIVDESGTVIGAIQWYEEDEPDYRHATIDIYLDPSRHGQGLGTDALRTLIGHLIDEVGHHRITIDPAADNEPAIRSYRKAGFREVGVMRQYERDLDGTWHDGLLMELLAEDFAPLAIDGDGDGDGDDDDDLPAEGVDDEDADDDDGYDFGDDEEDEAAELHDDDE